MTEILRPPDTFKPVPTYEHDCSKCTFVASIGLLGRTVDIWKSCSSPSSSGYIIRYSSEGSDYGTTYNHSHLPLEKKYRCGYKKNPSGVILSLDHYVCEMVEKLVNEITGETK